MSAKSTSQAASESGALSEPRSSRTSLFDLLLLGLLAAASNLAGLGARDLWNPNEPIYGRAVVEMAEAGQWLVPTLNGQTFAEKPILYYWLALVSGELFGTVDEFTLRLPTVAVGVLCVLLIYALVLPYAGRKRAVVAALLLLTQYQVWWTTGAIQMDIMVLAATLGALLPLTRMLDHGLRPRTAWLLAGAACGLGFAAKGPVTLVVPALAFLAYVALDRRPLRAWLPGLQWGIASGLLLGAPWYLALLVAGRQDVVLEVLLRQNFQRFTEAWDHVQPWWYYLGYFWTDFFPWSWLVPIAAAVRAESVAEKRLHRLSWVWLGAAMIFFSLSESKRAPYMLPIAPAVAILASAVVLRFESGRLTAGARRAVIAALAVIGVLMTTIGGLLLGPMPARWLKAVTIPYPNQLAAGFLAIGLLVLTGLVLHRRRPELAWRGLLTGLIALYVVASVWLLPAINQYKSVRHFMADVVRASTAAGSDQKASLASFQIPYRRAGYIFYGRQNIPDLEQRQEVVDFCSTSLPHSYVIVESTSAASFHQIVGPVEAAIEGPAGSRAAYAFRATDFCGRLQSPEAAAAPGDQSLPTPP